MADRVASNVIVSQERRKIIQFYNVSDGTGESAVVKVSKAALVGPHDAPIRIMHVWGIAFGMHVNIFFDHTADDLILSIPDGNDVDQDYSCFGGLPDPASAGGNGDLIFTTVGHDAGDTYAIIVEFRW